MSNFKQAIKANKTAKTSSTKKSSVPTINEIPDEVQADIKEYVKLQKKKKEVEAELKAVSSGIIEFARGHQDEQGFESNFSKSYNLGDVTYVSKNAFSINAEDEKQIKRLLGASFAKLIAEKISVKVKDEVLESEKLQEELMALLGDNFSKFFDVESSLKAKDDFDKNIYEVVKTQDKLDEVRVFVKPYKPTLK